MSNAPHPSEMTKGEREAWLYGYRAAHDILGHPPARKTRIKPLIVIGSYDQDRLLSVLSAVARPAFPPRR